MFRSATRWGGVFGLLLGLWLAGPGCDRASAQMVSGDKMQEYGTVFGVAVAPEPQPAFDVFPMENLTAAGNVLAPGQQPRLLFHIANNSDQPIATDGRVDIVHYGTRGISGDIWKPVVYKIGDVPGVPIRVDIPAKGTALVPVEALLPETFGAYAFVVDLGEHGRRFAVSVVRTFAPTPKRIQFPALALDASAGLPVLKGLGLQAVRIEWGFAPPGTKRRDELMADLRKRMAAFQENNITVLLTLSFFQDDMMPLGRGRPHLDDLGNMRATKEDLVNLPEHDPLFREYVAEICREFGWPKGPLTAVQLWNEPWEGHSISGWGADIIRYRDLYTQMALGVEDARADGYEVLITGCDSSSNSMDKLFPDGKDDFLKWYDACTIHYQGLWSPALYKKWRNREHPQFGRVKIWDTESWVANTDDRIAAVIAGCRAAGYDRAKGIFHGNVASRVARNLRMPEGAVGPDGLERKSGNYETFFPWSPAAAIGAAQHFIGERPFREFLFQNGLPWVMRFDGVENADDGTVVIVGDFREAFQPEMLLYRNVRGLDWAARDEEKAQVRARLAENPPGAEKADLQRRLLALDVLANGKMTLANPDGAFSLYDFHGNPVVSEAGQVIVPLNSLGYYLRTDGRAGSFDRLLDALRAARIDAYQPVDIVARDFLAPIAPGAELRLTLKNILNRPVTGTLAVACGGVEFAPLPDALTLAPGEVRDLRLSVAAGTPNPGNLYALRVRFDAGPDGAAEHAENLRVNRVARRTVAVDGDLSDWEGVLPQPVAATGRQGPTLTEAAWLPMNKFDEKEGTGVGTGYLAHDADYFYFAAKIADTTPFAGVERYANRTDEDQYFYPEVARSYDRQKVLWPEERDWNKPARAALAPQRPDDPAARHFRVWDQGLSGDGSAFAFDFDFPADKVYALRAYIIDPDDPMGNNVRRFCHVRIVDPETGRELAGKGAWGVEEGGYYGFHVKGKVRLLIVSAWMPCPKLAALFLDEDEKAPKPPADAINWARSMNDDPHKGGDWIGVYGEAGYLLPGLEAKLPEGMTYAIPEYKEMSEYRWPEGVRRFSYRRDPVLPAGNMPNFDNVQIAFNVVPVEDEPDMLPSLPGVPVGFIPYKDTDHEYALNPVADVYGGGTEIWRLTYPGMPEKHFYPRQPVGPHEGAVANGRLAIRYDGATRLVEAAIPWSEMPLVKQAVDEGRPVKFSFRVNDNSGQAMELGNERSVSQMSPYTFQVRWAKHWSNELEFAFDAP